MSEAKHTPGWIGTSDRLPEQYKSVLIRIKQDGEIVERVGRLNHAGHWQLASYQDCRHQYMADVVQWFDVAALATQRDELLEALLLSDQFIDHIREDLHSERAANWYPEGANNAALSMSESMRLIGNRCADFVAATDAIAKATGSPS